MSIKVSTVVSVPRCFLYYCTVLLYTMHTSGIVVQCVRTRMMPLSLGTINTTVLYCTYSNVYYFNGDTYKLNSRAVQRRLAS